MNWLKIIGIYTFSIGDPLEPPYGSPLAGRSLDPSLRANYVVEPDVLTPILLYFYSSKLTLKHASILFPPLSVMHKLPFASNTQH